MKYFTVCLLLVVCFFGGMTYGTMETNHALVGPEEQVVEEDETMQMDPFTAEALETRQDADLDQDESVIHQAASLFEKIFLSIYSLIINLIYSIADLFF